MTGNPQDMKFASYTKPASGDVFVWAAGFRNPFDCHLTIEDELFCTDNGPNKGFGGLIQGFAPNPEGFLLPKLITDESGRFRAWGFGSRPFRARAPGFWRGWL